MPRPSGASSGIRAACAVALVAASGCLLHPGQDVRYEPTPMRVVRTMLQMAAVGPGDVVYDLGSGDGRVVVTAAREFGARGVGIEIHPPLLERARARAAREGVSDRVEFKAADMYGADVSGATVVTLFLHPQPNLKLRPTLRATLPAGARIVSYMWDMGDWEPDEVRRVGRHRVFLWRVPGRGEAAQQK